MALCVCVREIDKEWKLWITENNQNSYLLSAQINHLIVYTVHKARIKYYISIMLKSTIECLVSQNMKLVKWIIKDSFLEKLNVFPIPT